MVCPTACSAFSRTTWSTKKQNRIDWRFSEMQTVECDKWLRAAANLRVDRKDNIAPHKPLLLLVVAELAEQGKLEPILSLTDEFVFRFLVFWTVVATRRSQ